MKPSLSILHWTSSPFQVERMGGIEVVESHWLQLLESKFDVRLFAPAIHGTLRHAVALRHLSVLKKYDIFYYKRFCSLNKKTNYIIGSNTPFLVLFRTKGVTLFFHNFIRFKGKDVFLPLYSIFKKRYHRVRILFCSEFLQREFEKLYPDFPSEQLKVVHNAVEEESIYTEKDPYTEEQVKKIVFVGQWSTDKGFDVAVQAVQELRKQRDDVELYCIGSETLWGNTKGTITTSAESSSYIHLLGALPHDQVLQQLREMDILLVPSRWKEPFGIVAVEGLASGCVVVSSTQGGLKEIIQHKKNGLHCDPQSLSNVISVVQQALDLKPEQQMALRHNAVADIKKRFTWKQHIQKLVSTLQQ